LEKAERELKRSAAVRRKKPNPQKLASQVGRTLQRLKAHKYFQYQVNEQGQLEYQKNDEPIQSEQNLDGLYLRHNNVEADQCAKERVLGNYKSLLAVEDCALAAYCRTSIQVDDFEALMDTANTKIVRRLAAVCSSFASTKIRQFLPQWKFSRENPGK
jgi:hypothetical protein